MVQFCLFAVRDDMTYKLLIKLLLSASKLCIEGRFLLVCVVTQHRLEYISILAFLRDFSVTKLLVSSKVNMSGSHFCCLECSCGPNLCEHEFSLETLLIF